MSNELRPLDLIPVIPPLNLEHFLAPTVARPWIEEGCKWAPEWDADDISALLRAGNLMLWVAWDREAPKEERCAGAMVIRVAKWKTGELVASDVAFAARDKKRVLPLLDRVEQFYREQLGVTRFRFIAGRNGWERALPQYRRVGVVLEKVL